MLSLSPSIDGARLIVGDFNLIRLPREKNNDRFDAGRASAFNAMINALAWLELPFSDRLYTWSSKRDPPTLARLDRAFFDAAWDSLFPDSTLASRPRTTSDHVPLVVSVSTRIPSAGRFFFENSWLLDPLFLPAVLPSWSRVPSSPCAATRLARQKKCLRSAAKVWKRQHKFIPVFDNNCKFLIDLLDYLEEHRRLSPAEIALRSDARLALAGSVARQAAYWRQRGKCRAVAEGDENTGYFHARASQRRRGNAIRVLAVDGVELVAHNAKEAALRRFYSNLLGRAPAPPGGSTWRPSTPARQWSTVRRWWRLSPGRRSEPLSSR
ncbi:uncharacterized protein [Aegilops tauschii subsp. strangulata]|uniref:uncharacterized protein n=1 Tax=Aegilops tauschii subsp. strangulata TaxID=200361 RepID=UPI003CC855AE